MEKNQGKMSAIEKRKKNYRSSVAQKKAQP